MSCDELDAVRRKVDVLQALLDRANAERDEARTELERMKGNAWPAMCASVAQDRDEKQRERDEARALFNRHVRRVAQDMELEEEWGLLLELEAIPWVTFEATGDE